MYMNDLLFNVISGFVLDSFLLVFLTGSFLYYYKMKLKPSLYTSLMWVFYLIWSLSFSIGLLIFDPSFLRGLIFLMGSYALIPAGYMALLSKELLIKDKIPPKKLIFFTILAILLLFSPFYERIWSVLRPLPVILAISFQDILWGLEIMLLFDLVIRLLFSFNWINFFYQMLVRYKETPDALNAQAKILLLSNIVLAIITPSLFWFIHIPYILGTVFICLNVGIVLLLGIYLKNPILLHFIPIRILRLTVMEVNSGKSVYTYKWETKKDLVDEDLFAAMLKGVNSILNESLSSGAIQEINLDEGVLIFKKIQETGFIAFLIALRSSKILNNSLKIFTKKFFNNYNKYLNVYWDKDNFITTDKLVKEIFSYLPDFLGLNL